MSQASLQQQAQGTLPRALRWAALLVLLPTPLWFLAAVVSDAGPAWRAQYHGSLDFSGPAALTAERRLSRYWDRTRPLAPGGFDARTLSARFDTCLELADAREIPFQLVANGAARFSIDGQERLVLNGVNERVARGEVLRLDPGVHHLEVELTGSGWPSIALQVSLDGRAPVAVPPLQSVAGASWFHPLPGDTPCPPER